MLRGLVVMRRLSVFLLVAAASCGGRSGDPGSLPCPAGTAAFCFDGCQCIAVAGADAGDAEAGPPALKGTDASLDDGSDARVWCVELPGSLGDSSVLCPAGEVCGNGGGVPGNTCCSPGQGCVPVTMP
jgi:hypothetical protein